jgi:hypothetical protein
MQGWESPAKRREDCWQENWSADYSWLSELVRHQILDAFIIFHLKEGVPMIGNGSNMVIFVLLFAVMAGSLVAQELPKPRLFIEESTSWEVNGSSGASDGAGAGVVGGGARGQTAELIKTFRKRCPEFTITNKRDRADYILTFDHEGGKQIWQKDNKFAVFNKEGDAVESGSARSLGSAVKSACEALKNDWQAQGSNAERSEN